MKTIIIDNYDSFTYNLYQLVGEVANSSDKNIDVLVFRNDKITLSELGKLKPDKIIISPGGGNVYDKKYFGICDDIILNLGKDIPLFGVCLGMQGIVKCFGGDIIKLSPPVHGKVSDIHHNSLGIYKGIPQNIEVMRYHSLNAMRDSIPDELEITSMSAINLSDKIKNSNSIPNETDFRGDAYKKEVVMGVSHKKYPIHGVQFHLESFGSEGGYAMMKNFLSI